MIINKFRGDVAILEPGLRMIEEKLGIPVVGVVPWTDADIEDEDSVSERLLGVSGHGEITVAVVRLKHISNFTDFQALSLHPGVTLKYASKPSDFDGADVIILPGTKNTIDDLIDLKNRDADRHRPPRQKREAAHRRVRRLYAGPLAGPHGVESAAPGSAEQNIRTHGGHL